MRCSRTSPTAGAATRRCFRWMSSSTTPCSIGCPMQDPARPASAGRACRPCARVACPRARWRHPPGSACSPVSRSVCPRDGQSSASESIFISWNTRGGYFAALDTPDALVSDIRDTSRSQRWRPFLARINPGAFAHGLCPALDGPQPLRVIAAISICLCPCRTSSSGKSVSARVLPDSIWTDMLAMMIGPKIRWIRAFRLSTAKSPAAMP